MLEQEEDATGAVISLVIGVVVILVVILTVGFLCGLLGLLNNLPA